MAQARLGLRRQLATTPGRIVAGLAAVALAALLGIAINLGVAARTAQTVQTLGSDAEPSVILALRISTVLSDLDATAAEDMLSGGALAAGTSQHWRDDKAMLDDLVIQASRNITYPAETDAIRGLLRWIGAYQTSLAEIRGVAERPWTAAQRLLWSHRLLQGFALPQARALEEANVVPLLQAYESYRSAALPQGALAALPVALLLALLVVLQVFLTRRTHRLLNLPLAGASLLTAALLAGAVLGTLAEREAVRGAKADCYDSLYPLFGARATAAAMNADLLLWMLDPGTREVAARDFDAGAHRLLDIDLRDDAGTAPYVAALVQAQRLERAGNIGQALRAVPPAHGLLADELANITFGTAERDVATKEVLDLISIVHVSDRIRQTVLDGHDIDAAALRQTDGDAAFAAFDATMARTIAINQAEFDSHIADARRLIGWTPLAACAGLLLAAVLAGTGLWQRLAEYR